MPLPDDGATPWPPATVRDANDGYRRWHAWYAGEPDLLTAVYMNTPPIGGGNSTADIDKKGVPGGARYIGAMSRGMQRMFWGAAITASQLRAHKLHIPLAGDIATTSADLLYGEPVLFEWPDQAKKNATSVRLSEIVEEANADAVWLEAAELSAAYGGAYVRIRIDRDLADGPLLDVIPPDAAVPEFRGSRLTAVTFWRNLPAPDGDGRAWRHLERHEPGKIVHGLYVGGEDKLGRRMPLTAHDETAPLAQALDPGSADTITTGADGLTAEYLPNMRPNRVMRGSPLGRSDFAGVEGLLDSLDEAWTSWIRDLRIGKGRIVVPRSYIRGRGRGQGGVFDPEQEVYEAVDSLETPGASMSITNVQFAIRVTEHAQTCQHLVEQIVRAAGYSAQTFGADTTSMKTATEVVSRQARSLSTRAKKILYQRGPLQRLAQALLQVDAARFGPKKGVILDERPTVKWSDGVATDPESVGRILQLLKAAESASTATRVRMLNPDWEEPEIDAEVQRILDEGGAAPAGGGFPPPGQAAHGVPVDGQPDGGHAAGNGQQPPGNGGQQKQPPGGQPNGNGNGGGQQLPRGRGNGPPTGKPAPPGPAGPGSRAKT